MQRCKWYIFFTDVGTGAARDRYSQGEWPMLDSTSRRRRQRRQHGTAALSKTHAVALSLAVAADNHAVAILQEATLAAVCKPHRPAAIPAANGAVVCIEGILEG